MLIKTQWKTTLRFNVSCRRKLIESLTIRQIVVTQFMLNVLSISDAFFCNFFSLWKRKVHFNKYFYLLFSNHYSSNGVQTDYIDLYYPLFCFSFWLCISLYLINFNVNLFICNCWWVEFKAKAIIELLSFFHNGYTFQTWQQKYNF
jgi:hypothetical protein